MKITVSVTIQADDDAPAMVSDVFTLNRDHSTRRPSLVSPAKSQP